MVISSVGRVVTAVFDTNGRRAVIDGGFTRLYNKWDTAGTARFVKNAAVWLTNYDTLPLKSERPHVLDFTPAAAINWSAQPTLVGVAIKHELPKDLEDLIDKVDRQARLGEDVKTSYFVKIAPQPFAGDGGTRLPYYMKHVSADSERG